MTTVAEFTDKLRVAAEAEPVGAGTLKIDLKGEGVIRIAGAVVDNQDLPADCTVRVAKADLEKIASGDLDPTVAFMTGKLRVDGNIGVAMALQSVMARAFG
jgi:putative sterol carrier protein